MVRDEMLENPILEDSVESANEQAKAADAPAEVGRQRRRRRAGRRDRDADRRDSRRQGRHDRRGEGGHRLERGGQRLRLGGLPGQPGGGRADAVVQVQQRGSAVAGSDADPRHVAVQPPRVAAQAEPLHAGRRRHRDADHRQPDAGRLSGRSARGSGGRGERHAGARRVGAEAGPGVRPGRGGRAVARGVPADPGAPHRRRRRRGGRHHHQAPRQPREEELPGDRQGPGPAGRGDLRSGEGPQELRPEARARVHRRRADLHHARRLRPQGRATSTSSSRTTTACPS